MSVCRFLSVEETSPIPIFSYLAEFRKSLIVKNIDNSLSDTQPFWWFLCFIQLLDY